MQRAVWVGLILLGLFAGWACAPGQKILKPAATPAGAMTAASPTAVMQPTSLPTSVPTVAAPVAVRKVRPKFASAMVASAPVRRDTPTVEATLSSQTQRAVE